MTVSAISVFLTASGKRRGRICLRVDGLFQYGTERWQEEIGDSPGYWLNDYPPSGLFCSQEEAVAALSDEIGPMTELENSRPAELDLSVGPYPEP